jgi:hypothetical protein
MYSLSKMFWYLILNRTADTVTTGLQRISWLRCHYKNTSICLTTITKFSSIRNWNSSSCMDRTKLRRRVRSHEGKEMSATCEPIMLRSFWKWDCTTDDVIWGNVNRLFHNKRWMLAWKTPCRCEGRDDSRDGATTTDRPSCCEYRMEKFNDRLTAESRSVKGIWEEGKFQVIKRGRIKRWLLERVSTTTV